MRKLSFKKLKANWILILQFLHPNEPIKAWCLTSDEIGHYHDEWDWLMPLWNAVNKSNYSIIIYPDYCYLIDDDGMQINSDYYSKTIEMSIYLACVDAIKLINKQK